MLPHLANEPAISREALVVTKAATRAADRLGLKNNVLGRIVGLSEPTISRMRKGRYVIDPNHKSFELALLFVRLYRSLDAVVGGDETVAADWLANNNTALNGKPIDLIQSISGLISVITYLDSRRAVV
ncbi:MAG: antitoxin Xre/MbcA/ParS toxin-binding domain-containing protein [Pseudomonadota bacterium]